MCKAMSGYIIAHGDSVRVLVSEKTDSHTDIAAEFNIRDTALNAGRVYAFEFYPDDGNPSPDVSTWTLAYDSWATLSCREAAPDEVTFAARRQIEAIAGRWVATNGEQVVTMRGWAFGSAKQTVNGGVGRAYDSATQTVNGGEGWAYDSATQTVNGGEGWAFGSATQTVNGGEGWAFGSATQIDNRSSK